MSTNQVQHEQVQKVKLPPRATVPELRDTPATELLRQEPERMSQFLSALGSANERVSRLSDAEVTRLLAAEQAQLGETVGALAPLVDASESLLSSSQAIRQIGPMSAATSRSAEFLARQHTALADRFGEMKDVLDVAAAEARAMLSKSQDIETKRRAVAILLAAEQHVLRGSKGEFSSLSQLRAMIPGAAAATKSMEKTLRALTIAGVGVDTAGYIGYLAVPLLASTYSTAIPATANALRSLAATLGNGMSPPTLQAVGAGTGGVAVGTTDAAVAATVAGTAAAATGAAIHQIDGSPTSSGGGGLSPYEQEQLRNQRREFWLKAITFTGTALAGLAIAYRWLDFELPNIKQNTGLMGTDQEKKAAEATNDIIGRGFLPERAQDPDSKQVTVRIKTDKDGKPISLLEPVLDETGMVIGVKLRAEYVSMANGALIESLAKQNQVIQEANLARFKAQQEQAGAQMAQGIFVPLSESIAAWGKNQQTIAGLTVQRDALLKEGKKQEAQALTDSIMELQKQNIQNLERGIVMGEGLINDIIAQAEKRYGVDLSGVRRTVRGDTAAAPSGAAAPAAAPRTFSLSAQDALLFDSAISQTPTADRDVVRAASKDALAVLANLSKAELDFVKSTFPRMRPGLIEANRDKIIAALRSDEIPTLARIDDRFQPLEQQLSRLSDSQRKYTVDVIELMLPKLTGR